MNNRIVAFWHYRLVSCYVERHRSSTGAPFVLHHGASIVVAVVATTVYSFAGKKAACFELAIRATACS
ncbi:hypothetical protein ACSQ67_009908 [Phaseolus vulgaris]